VAAQASELPECEIGITPFDCPRDNHPSLGRARIVVAAPGAQIRLTTDVARGLEYSLTLTQEAEVVEAVRAWLSEMLAAAGGAKDDSGDR
jgi:hypothetical protein